MVQNPGSQGKHDCTNQEGVMVVIISLVSVLVGIWLQLMRADKLWNSVVAC